MLKITITHYMPTDAGIWPAVGPLLCTPELHRSLGGPVVADSSSRWWVARRGRDVVGFTTVRQVKDAWLIEASFVVAGDRGEGVHAALCEARDQMLVATRQAVEVVCKLERWHHYEAQGFKVVRQRGQWVTGRKEQL